VARHGEGRCLRRGDFLRDGAGWWIDWTLLERPPVAVNEENPA
jgi:hypothetical protein